MGSLNIESSTGANNTAATAAAAAEADKDLPSIILFMRLVNMGAAGALIAISVSLFIICKYFLQFLKNLCIKNKTKNQ
jgi:hypothetical protein